MINETQGEGIHMNDLIIRQVNCYDTLSQAFRGNCDILIKDGRIENVSMERLEAAAGCEIINGESKYLIPGLFNLHSHPQRRHVSMNEKSGPFRVGAAAVEDLPDTQRMAYAIRNIWTEMLLEGVTTIRAAGSKNCLNIELRDAITNGIICGPNIIATGPILSTTGGHATVGIDGAMEVDGVDEVRKTVRMILKKEADWIKLCVSGGLAGIHKGEHPSMVQFTYDEVAAAVDEAHRKNRKVMVHCMSSEAAEMAIKAGVDCIEHGNLLTDSVLGLMKEKSIPFVPTMSGIWKVYQREFDAGNTRVANLLREVIFPHKDVVRHAIDAGILIGTGTDTLGSVIEEMRMFIQCGMTNAQALNAATVNSARIVDLEGCTGTIEPGKNADLVLLGGNPLKNIDEVKHIEKVFLKGKVFEPRLLQVFKYGS